MVRSGRVIVVALSIAILGTGPAPAAAQSSPPGTPCLAPGESPPAGASDGAQPSGATEPGTTATVVTSDDGLLTIEIPAGAAPPDVTVSATYQDPACAAPELAGVPFRNGFYALRPAGITFTAPVRVTRTVTLEQLDIDPAGGVIPLIGLAARSADGSWAWLEDLTLDFDRDTATIALGGELSHFTDLYGLSSGDSLALEVEPTLLDLAVGDEASVSATLVGAGRGTAAIGGSDLPAPASASVVGEYPVIEMAGLFNSDNLVVSATMVETGPNRVSSRFACIAEGSSRVGFDLDIAGLANDVLTGLGLPPVAVDTDAGTVMTCRGGGSQVDGAVAINQACVQVVHHPLHRFISYLHLLFYLSLSDGPEVLRLEIIIRNANNDKPVRARVKDGAVSAKLGLTGTGDKVIERVIAVTKNGREDITDAVLRLLPKTLAVRFPQADSWGACAEA